MNKIKKGKASSFPVNFHLNSYVTRYQIMLALICPTITFFNNIMMC